MITSDYHIVSPEADFIDWSQSRLVIELNRQFFHYTILLENTIVALKYYRITPSPERGAVEMLEDIIAGDPLLNKNIKVQAVIYNLPENHLVPEEFYEEDRSRDLINLLHGDLKKDMVRAEKIRNAAIHNIYLVPADVHRFLEQKFAPAQYRHFYTLWLEWQQKQEQDGRDSIHALFYPNELMVMLLKNHAVTLIQTFAYETVEDVGYHLLNTYHQHNLSPQELPLKISGMLATDSAMYEELQKYFMRVETVPPPAELTLAPDFELFPPHFFSPILKMAVCV